MKKTDKFARTILFILPILIFCSCKLPDRRITGVYLSDRGDTMRVNNNRSFKAEMLKPDSTSDQQKFTSGRWHTEGRKIYFTMAARDMGNYWSCIPMSVRLSHLKRPVACEGEGDDLNFKKVHVKKPKVKKGKNGEDEKLPEEVMQEMEKEKEKTKEKK